MFKYGMIGVMSLLLAGPTVNQKNQPFEISKEKESFLVTGTSTLHDWKMDLKIFDCNANFIMEGPRLTSIDQVAFNCKATDLKSDNSLMDKKAYSALKSGTFPEIKFNGISPIEISVNNNKFTDNLRGNLFIAGKSITVLIPINGTFSSINGNNIIEVSGETDLKLSSFNIVPPTAMLGTLKTGDGITVSFSLRFMQKLVK
jgi:YceI-like domain.